MFHRRPRGGLNQGRSTVTSHRLNYLIAQADATGQALLAALLREQEQLILLPLRRSAEEARQ